MDPKVSLVLLLVIAGALAQTWCGNGLCEEGETWSNCCWDCSCGQGQFCMVDRCLCTEAQCDCTNPRCLPATQKTCGNGACDAGETQATCCQDCGCDGTCQRLEKAWALLQDPEGRDVRGVLFESGKNVSFAGVELYLVGVDSRPGAESVLLNGYRASDRNPIESVAVHFGAVTSLKAIGIKFVEYEIEGSCEKEQPVCGDSRCESGENSTVCCQDCGCEGTCTAYSKAWVSMSDGQTSQEVVLETGKRVTIGTTAFELTGIDSRNPAAVEAVFTAYPSGQQPESAIAPLGSGTYLKGVSITFNNYLLGGVCQLPASCGNNACETEEDQTSCCQDCGCPSGQTCQDGACVTPQQINQCGNGACETGENSTTCCSDCGCASGFDCTNNQCIKKIVPPVCGNHACETGETRLNCCQDCGCQTGFECITNSCVKKEEIPQCAGVSDCDDGLSCTIDVCFSGKCGHSRLPGCDYKDGCAETGVRAVVNETGSYCSLENTWIPQKAENGLCMNNYECTSNLCSDGTCVSLTGLSALIQALIDLLKKIFGG